MKYIKLSFFLILCLLAITACQKPEPQTQLPEILAAPQNVRIEDEILKWDAVPNAAGYTVIEGENQYEITDTFLDVFTITLRTDKVYSFSVIANGDDQNFWDSEPSATCSHQTKQGVTWLVQLINNGTEYMVKPSDPEKISGKILIPNVANDLPVTQIANGAFYNCTQLTGVVINDNIEIIGANAFEGCTNLTRVSMQDSVVTIDSGAFSNCEKLWDIRFSFNLSIIGPGAFSDCKNLKTLHLPDSVASINSNAFANCESLEDIRLPPNLNTVGARAFANCKSLTRLHIPDTVEKLADGLTGSIVDGCTALSELTVDPGNTAYRSEGNCIIRRSDNALILTCKTSVIPQGVEIIAAYAFSGSTLTAVTVPDGVKKIGRGAFSASALEQVHFENGLAEIAANAFSDCTFLRSVTLPASLQSIDVSAFQGCYSLQSLTVDEANPVYQSIGNCIIRRDAPDTLLLGCVGSLIPEGIRVIGKEAFSRYSGTSIRIPEGVEELGERAFAHSSLQGLELPSTVKKLGNSCFGNCTMLTSVALPQGLEELGAGCFDACVRLAEIDLPDGITEIGARTFFDCISLARVKLPKGLLTVGMYAFCKVPLSFVLPASLQSVGKMAFQYGTVYTSATAEQIRSWKDVGIFFYGCAYAEDAGVSYLLSVDCASYIGSNAWYDAPTREGYTFAGWATEENGEPVYLPRTRTAKVISEDGGVGIQRECTYALTRDELQTLCQQGTTLYAVWVKNT